MLGPSSNAQHIGRIPCSQVQHVSLQVQVQERDGPQDHVADGKYVGGLGGDGHEGQGVEGLEPASRQDSQTQVGI
jgi:hypothetical protein